MTVILPHPLFLLELRLRVDIIPEDIMGSSDSCKCPFASAEEVHHQNWSGISCALEMERAGTPNLPREEELRSKLDLIKRAKALK